MKEENRNILLKGLQELPSMVAPEFIWDRIEDQLDIENNVINPNSLDAALAEFPLIDCPDFVWNRIEDHLDNDDSEFHASTLENSIADLPELIAPDFNWDKISSALDEFTNQETTGNLQTAIADLPILQAPNEIWDSIENTLSKEEQSNSRPIIRMWARRTSAIAAALLILFIGTFIIKIYDNSDDFLMSYTEENVNNSLQVTNLELSNPAIEIIEQYCQVEAIACKDPVFKSLKGELDLLTVAMQELQNAINEFNDDVNLTAQIVAIERDRSELINTLIKMI